MAFWTRKTDGDRLQIAQSSQDVSKAFDAYKKWSSEQHARQQDPAVPEQSMSRGPPRQRDAPDGAVVRTSSISSDADVHVRPLKLPEMPSLADPGAASPWVAQGSSSLVPPSPSTWSGAQAEEIVAMLDAEQQQLIDALSRQRAINGDLKRLLVASVGDRVSERCDSLVKEREDLASHGRFLASRLREMEDAIEQERIRMDVWRAKAQALAIAAGEGAAARREAAGILRGMIEERAAVRTSLAAAFVALSRHFGDARMVPGTDLISLASQIRAASERLPPRGDAASAAAPLPGSEVGSIEQAARAFVEREAATVPALESEVAGVSVERTRRSGWRSHEGHSLLSSAAGRAYARGDGGGRSGIINCCPRCRGFVQNV